MNALVSTSDLHNTLSKLTPLTKGPNTNLSQLAYTKLEAKEDLLYFSGSNLEVWADKKIPATVREAGTLFVNTTVFNNFVSTLGVDGVTLKADGEHLVVEGENVRAVINGIVADDFPTKPIADFPQSMTIDTPTFFNGIAQVADVASDDQFRPILTGVYLHSRNGRLYMAATDGAHVASQPLMDTTEEVSLVLPAKAVQYLPKLFDDEGEIFIDFNDTMVSFNSSTTSLLCRLVEGQYPEYEKLISQTFKSKIEVNKKDLERALQSATVFSKSMADSATLVFSEDNQTLAIEGQELDTVGSAKVSVEIKMEGEPISVRLNGRFAQNALAHIKEDTVQLGFNEATLPILFTDDLEADSYKHVVMPLAK